VERGAGGAGTAVSLKTEKQKANKDNEAYFREEYHVAEIKAH